MSSPGIDQESLAALARLELLQGTGRREAALDRRRQLYDRFGRPDEPWAGKAWNAYRAMHQMDGFVASVGDQLACELDIQEHAGLYAAVGGFDVGEITQGLGAWWSPSATWFQWGRTLAEGAELADPALENFAEMSRLLLDAGAHSLATFFTRVATGGAALTRTGGRVRRRRPYREIAFIAEVARRRGLLFRDGPDENGRYFGEDDVNQGDIVETVMRPLPATFPRTRRARRAQDQ